MEAVTDFLFLGSKITSIMVIEAMKFKDAYSLEENYDKPRQCFKKQRHYLADKGPYSQSYGFSRASLVPQTVKNLPAMRETWVRSLDWEDLLEEGMATHSGILAWRIPLDRGAWGATVHGVKKSRTRLK